MNDIFLETTLSIFSTPLWQNMIKGCCNFMQLSLIVFSTSYWKRYKNINTNIIKVFSRISIKKLFDVIFRQTVEIGYILFHTGYSYKNHILFQERIANSVVTVLVESTVVLALIVGPH